MMTEPTEYVNVTLRLPRPLHEWLRQSADTERRSMSAQTLYLLEQARQQRQQTTEGRRRQQEGQTHG